MIFYACKQAKSPSPCLCLSGRDMSKITFQTFSFLPFNFSTISFFRLFSAFPGTHLEGKKRGGVAQESFKGMANSGCYVREKKKKKVNKIKNPSLTGGLA